MKDFELQLRIRNNRIKERRTELGLTIAEASRRAGVKANEWCSLETMRDSPLGRRPGFIAAGTVRAVSWRKAALAVASFLGVEPEELWPDSVLAVKKTCVATQVDAATMLVMADAATPRSLPGPDDLLAHKEEWVLLHSMLKSLDERSRQVVLGRMQGETFDDIGASIGVCGQQAQNVHDEAVRDLQQINKANEMRCEATRFRLLSRGREPMPYSAAVGHQRVIDTLLARIKSRSFSRRRALLMEEMYGR
jgi:lambda repressor-like predicted transcriptional regulator